MLHKSHCHVDYLLSLPLFMCIKRSYSFVRCSFDSLPSFTPAFLNIWLHYLFMLLVHLKWWLFYCYLKRSCFGSCSFYSFQRSVHRVCFFLLFWVNMRFFFSLSLFTHFVLSAARSEIKAKTKLLLEQVSLLVCTKREMKKKNIFKQREKFITRKPRSRERSDARARAHTIAAHRTHRSCLNARAL